VRIVVPEAEARGTAGVGEFLQRITFEGRGIVDVEGMPGLEHREALAVLRGDDPFYPVVAITEQCGARCPRRRP
jgi:hypothetical protein